MKKIYHVLISLVISIMLVFALQNCAYAAGATLSASQSSVEKGTSVTISANISDAASWNLDISTTGGNLSKTDNRVGTSDSGNNESKTVGVGTFTADEAGTYTITLTGSVVDGSQEIPSRVTVSDSVTITVTAPEPEEPEEPEQPEQPEEPQEPEEPEQPEEPQEPEQPVEPNFTETNQTVYTTTDVNLRASWSTGSSAVRVPEGTELTLTGTSSETVNDYVWYRVTYNGETRYVVSKYTTTTKPEEEKPEEKSSNSSLSNLTVNLSKLTPEFNKDIKEYALTVGVDVESIEITAIPEDDKSKIEITGNTELKEGENIITITVTAEDETSSVYQITVTKTAEEQLKLSELEIKGYTLSPRFNPDKYEYTLSVKKDVSKLEIEALASKENVNIEIIGNNDFEEGENLVTIIVKSEDGSQTATYQITVEKEQVNQAVATTEDNGNKLDMIIYIAMAIVGILIVAIIIYIIMRKSGRRDVNSIDEEDDYEDFYNDSNNNMQSFEFNSLGFNKKEIENNEYNVFEDNTFEQFDSDNEESPRGRRGKHF